MLEALVVSAMTCCKSSYLSILVNCLSLKHTHTHTSESTEKQLVVGKEEEKATSLEQTGSGTAVSACVSDVEEALKDAGIYRDSLCRIR